MSLLSKYYEALYHTEKYKCVYAGQSKGMTVGLQNLSDIDFYTVYTVYPPFEEQEEIVEAIKGAEADFAKGKGSIEKQIDLLKEYRTRLISDVVTGQMDVRGIEIPDYVPEEENTADLSDETDEENETAGEEAEQDE